MNKNLSKLVKVLTITIVTLSLVVSLKTLNTKAVNNQLAIQQATQHQLVTALVKGDGTTSTIYLQVGTELQEYQIQSDFVGYGDKIITLDKEITIENYLDIKILNVDNIKIKNNIVISDVNNLI